MTLDINIERCKGCGLCILEYPEKILEMSEELNNAGYPYIQIKNTKNITDCKECDLCYQICPELCFTNSSD